MTATADQIARVRRMTAEPTTMIYADASIQAYIEAHPLVDVNGEVPYILESVAISPTQMINPVWIATYDLNAAAADIWEEKAAMSAGDYDFSADGGDYSRSQAYEQAMKQARYFRARRSMKTVTMIPTYPNSSLGEQ